MLPPRPLLSPALSLGAAQADALGRIQAQQATLHKAATMLQKMYRGKNSRRELERKRSGGKKGKGAKGGKKKK